MANEKILVVDDDANICELLRLYLTKEGYQVTVANDGEEGLEKFNAVKPDMVLLDVMMPRMDGFEVCRRIRKAGNTPVMMLTAKGETFDKVLGLELGADDYMVKPFDAKEVVARIKAVLRRCQTTSAAAESTEGVIEFDNLRLDMNSYELRVKGKVVEAPPKELELLNCLASHPNRVYTRDQLLDPAPSGWTPWRKRPWRYFYALLTHLELIAHTPDGFQFPLIGSPGQLFAQALDVDINGAAVAVILKAPHLVQQLVAGVHAVGMRRPCP